MTIDLYFDLDQTLADFETGLMWAGGQADSALNTSRDQLTIDQAQKKDANVRVIADNTPGFFAQLPLMPGAREMWDVFARLEPCVLTSIPDLGDPTKIEQAKQEKFRFVNERLGSLPIDRFLPVSRSRDKPNWMGDPAEAAQVLVDDRTSNVEAWREAGGYAVLHQDAETSIAAVREILEKVPRLSTTNPVAP